MNSNLAATIRSANSADATTGQSSNWGPLAAAMAVVALAFVPLLIDFFKFQWTRPEYQGFPLVIAAIGYFLWERWGERRRNAQPRTWVNVIAVMAMLAGCFLLWGAAYIYSPWLALVAWIVFSFGIVIRMRNVYFMPGLFGIWALQLVLLPLPLNYDQRLITRLQLLSSWMSSKILDALGVMHLMLGNTLSLKDKQLFVDEACSGIVSLVSIITCIIVYAIWQRRRLFHTLVLILAGGVWTTFMNTARICTIAIAQDWFEIDLAEGTPHMVLGLVLFAISVVVIYCFDRYLFELLVPVNVDWRKRDVERHAGTWMMYVWDEFLSNRAQFDQQVDYVNYEDEVVVSSGFKRRGGIGSLGMIVPWPMLIVLAGVGIWQLTLMKFSRSVVVEATRVARTSAIALDGDFRPYETDDHLKFLAFDAEARNQTNVWGEHSRLYRYTDTNGLEYQVSCDFLFGPFWHDLAVCYRGTGWDIANVQQIPLESKVKVKSEDGERDWLAEYVDIRRESLDENGIVLFSGFRSIGEPINPPIKEEWWRNFVTLGIGGHNREAHADYFQIQVAVFKTNGELTDEERENAKRLLTQAREKFRIHLTEQNWKDAP
jgi:exosortase